MSEDWYQYLGKGEQECIKLFDTLDFSPFLKNDVKNLYDIIYNIENYYGNKFEETTGGLLFNLFNTLEIIDYLESRYEVRFIEHTIFLKYGTGDKKLNDFNKKTK